MIYDDKTHANDGDDDDQWWLDTCKFQLTTDLLLLVYCMSLLFACVYACVMHVSTWFARLVWLSP